jgi:hypothetical protein
VRRHPTLTAPWGVGEDVPEVPTGDDHPTVHGYGAVAPLTGRPHAHLSPQLGQEACAPCLPHWLACHPGKRRVVMHDRRAQQKGTGLAEVVREAAAGLLARVASPRAPLEVVAACGHPSSLVSHFPGAQRSEPPFLPVPCRREQSGPPVMRRQKPRIFRCSTVAPS